MTTTLRRRPSRSVPAAIAAVLLVALGVTLAWAATQHLIDGTRPGWFGAAVDPIADARRAAPWTVTAFIAVAVLGVVCLLAAWIPGRRPGVPLSDGGIEEVLTERGLSRLVGSRVKELDGVDGVTVAVTRRRVAVTADTASGEVAAIGTLVRERVGEVLDQVGPRTRPSVAVRIRSKEER